MKQFTPRLARRRLEARLAAWRGVADEPPPGGGYIRAIREAIAMPGTELARRMGISQSTLHGIEQGERTGSVRLSSLRRAAEALDCTLVYAFVPRTSLDDIVNNQARRQAERYLERTEQTMLLEAQLPDAVEQEAMLEEIAEDIARSSRRLWAPIEDDGGA
jgi:predicted DNA-binding mobile mystery protein A